MRCTGQPLADEDCALCGRTALSPVHRPTDSTRGLTVMLCTACGLVQSTPRRDRAPRAPGRPSSGAGWGNLRYGKGFRSDLAVTSLRPYLGRSSAPRILDVGSNRGAFIDRLYADFPRAILTAVEPDERVAHAVAGRVATLLPHRIEETAFPAGAFDIIHSCHTIEHLADPWRVLCAHRAALAPEGVLYVDAPNIAFLAHDDVIEEWFIDKHLHHFSARTLPALLAAAGFDILERIQAFDRDNLTYLARPARSATPVPPDPEEVAGIRRLIALYQARLAENRRVLIDVAARVSKMAENRLAIWGAGRLLDALVVHGGLDPRRAIGLIDTHLAKLDTPVHGCRVLPPEALAELAPETILIMSRAFSAEIATRAAELAPQVRLLTFGELLDTAKPGPPPSLERYVS